MMPFYPFYWSDYNAKTLGLTRGQHASYFLLLKFYYCTGRRVPHEQRYSIAEALLEQDKSDTDAVLDLFFVREGDYWFMPRAEEVVAESDAKHEKRVNAAKSSKAKSSATAMPEQCSSNAPAVLQQPEPEPQPIKKEKNNLTVIPKEAVKRGTRLPDDFEPDESCMTLAREMGYTKTRWNACLAEFRDYWRSIGGQRGVRIDWQATFRNRLRNFNLSGGKINGAEQKSTIKGHFEVINAAIEAKRAALAGRAGERDEGGGDNLVSLPGLRENTA